MFECMTRSGKRLCDDGFVRCKLEHSFIINLILILIIHVNSVRTYESRYSVNRPIINFFSIFRSMYTSCIIYDITTKPLAGILQRSQGECNIIPSHGLLQRFRDDPLPGISHVHVYIIIIIRRG